MRIRWQGLELPSRVIRDDAVSTGSYGRFVIEPFEQGFGTTIGNSLRRVLLSSLEGAAATAVKIAGVSHEFATIEGVVEDITDIILNVKGIVLTLDDDEPRKMTVERNRAGEVKAGEIVADPSIRIVNPDHKIATLTSDVAFRMEMTVGKGRGYATGTDNRKADQEIGVIPVDSIYSPVLRVRYRTEDMRVGQRTNYDRLIMEIWTNGTIAPDDALVEAGLILRKHLNPFVMYHDLGDRLVAPRHQPAQAGAFGQSSLDELLDKPVSVLSLSARASNCLEAAKIVTIRQLVTLSDAELLRFRSFGKTSLHEVHRKLADVGLSLGMKLEGGAPGSEASSTESSGLSWAGASAGTETAGAASVPASAGPMESFTMGD